MSNKIKVKSFKDLVALAKSKPQKVKKQKAHKLPKQKPDTFEKTKPYRFDDMANMKFKTQKIEFYPEDLEKAKNMTMEEQTDFFIKLREENRYKVIKEKNNKTNQ